VNLDKEEIKEVQEETNKVKDATRPTQGATKEIQATTNSLEVLKILVTKANMENKIQKIMNSLVVM